MDFSIFIGNSVWGSDKKENTLQTGRKIQIFNQIEYPTYSDLFIVSMNIMTIHVM